MTALPAGWQMRTLGEVARWGSGGTPKAGTSRYYGGPIPWAVIGDLTDGPVSGTSGTLTEEGLSESSAKLVPPGAVLVAMYGSIGKLGIAMTEMATNQAIAFAVPHEGVIEPKFLFLYLMSQREDLTRAGKGATQQNIGQGTLKAWPLPLPPIEEQRRIVDILEDHLSRLDAAERELDGAAGRLARLRDQVVRHALFPSSPTTTPSVVPLPDLGVNDGEIPDLPNHWHWARLGELSEVVGGVTKDSSKQGDPTFVEVPYLRVANVQRGRLDLDVITKIRVPPDKAAKLELLPGDVLLNEGGDRDKLGRGWVWDGQIEHCIHQNHVFRARIRDGVLTPKLLSWAANSFGGRWCERNGKQSVNLASISLSKIRLMPVPVPPLGEQWAIERQIQAGLDSCDRLATSLAVARRESRALRRSLLGAAFRGGLSAASTATELREIAHV